MDRIGEYYVRRLVGEGGMGKVYEAEERLSRRRVALKVLRPELGRSEAGRQMFTNEMTILAHLDHPNIVRSLACHEVDGDLVMALEFLDGETLRAHLAARGRLPWTEAVAIAADVAAALTAAHGQTPPIVHRDLKPENLMIVNGRVKVMDFGIGKVLQAMKKGSSHAVGTLQYMSPEQIDAAGVDERSDLYSLGLVLWEMLVGHPPFQSESTRELLNLQCTAPPPPLPDDVRVGLPRGIERLLARLLAKAPADRPASAQEVVTALEPFAAAGDGPAIASAGASAAFAAAPRPGAPAASAGASAAFAATPRLAAGSSSELPVAAVGASAASAPAATPRLDTVALVDRLGKPAAAPTQVRTPWAIAIILALCALAGVAAYLVRTG